MPVHQLDIFATGIKYNKLCNMVMIIYWAKKNDPNGSTSSQIHANTCNTEDGAKEETFFGKKLQEPCPLWDPGLAERITKKKNFFSIFSIFHVYFSCLFSITRRVISCQVGMFWGLEGLNNWSSLKEGNLWREIIKRRQFCGDQAWRENLPDTT